jgi:hypothetical protein
VDALRGIHQIGGNRRILFIISCHEAHPRRSTSCGS